MLNSHILSNESKSINAFLTDSRKQNYDQNTLWDKLNFSQQYAVCSLGQFGYLLTYVRHFGDTTLAVLKQDGKIATINEAGVINVNPAIHCRQ